MKISILIKEVNQEEVKRTEFSSIKLAITESKKQRLVLDSDEKKVTKFRIIQKIKKDGSETIHK